MPGPYFPGQQPSTCGHYYPEVLRLRDERKPDGTFIRIMDCSYCGRYEIPLDARHLAKELVRRLKKEGRDVAIRDDEVAKVRKDDMDKLLSTSRKGAILALQSIIETAITEGAEAIELEYVSAGLEVTYVSGNLGIGEVIADRASVKRIMGELIAQAQLEHKSRGMLKWAYGGRSYHIRVEEYESFGESAFRLILKKPKRRA